MANRFMRSGGNLWLCACMAVSVFSAAFADGWSWEGKSGSVRIPSGVTAQVVDADVDVLASLTGIEIESGAVLNFANTSKRCELSAVLTGDGACRATSGALVTFAGASPDYTGQMVFSKAKIWVKSSRWGLGSGVDAFGAVRYVTSEEGALQFVADYTCDPGIYWYGHRYEASKSNTWFVDDMARKVVFNGPVKMNKSGNVDWMRTGNYVFNAGLGVNGSNGNFGVMVGDALSSVVTEIGAGSFLSGGSAYFPIRIEANAELLLKAGVSGSDIVFYGAGKVVCGNENVLPSVAACGLGRNDMKSGTIDLNGFDQNVKQLSSSVRWVWNAEKGEQDYVTVTSGTDAALTIVGKVSPVPHACGFSGRASLVQAGGGVYTMVNRFSDTKGTLRVENGTVKFDWGAGWGGDVEVHEKGRVVFADRCDANLTDPCEIVLFEGAKIEVGDDVTLVCEKLTVNGVEMASGMYTAENSGDWMVGGGTVAVKPAAAVYTAVRVWDGGGQGAGWAEAANWSDDAVPGAGEKALIPAGATVRISDADVDVVQGVAAIEVAQGGRLEFANAGTALVLTNVISGAGDICATDSKGITLAGYNFDHVGLMEFTNTPVYVTSRWGLGNPSRPVVHWGNVLRFRGEGLTNDVPIRIQDVRDAYKNRFTDNYADCWVQNGYLDYLLQSDSPRIGCGNYVFTGGLRNSAGALQFLVQDDMTCTIRKTPLALNINWSWSHFSLGNNATLRLETSGNKWTEEFSINGFGTLLCCVENALPSNRAMCLGQSAQTPVLDLGGHDQECLCIRNSLAPERLKYEATRGSDGYGVVTSANAATLTLTSASPIPTAVKFSGALNLVCVGSGVNTFVNQFSDTTGTLSVENGTVAFDWGAGWGGDILVRDGGKVVFAESCPSNSISRFGAVTIMPSAKLAVGAGARFCCATLKLGDELITSGIISSRTHPQWIEGDGSVYVGKCGLTFIVR